MYTRLVYIIFLVFMLCMVSNVQAGFFTWIDAGADHLWSTPENWDTGTLPTYSRDDHVHIPNVSGPIIANKGAVAGAVAVGPWYFTAELTVAGGTLEISRWLQLGQLRGSNGTVYMRSGTVTVAESMIIGYYGWGTLKMTGGTITVTGTFQLANQEGASGVVQLHGGILTANNLDIRWREGAGTTMDIGGGTLILNGNLVSKVQGYIDNAWITPYGGRGTLHLDYNVSNEGKTTLTATGGSDPDFEANCKVVIHQAEEKKRPKDAPAFFDMQALFFHPVHHPNIVVTTDGTVLAFATCGQVLRRSEDGGKTWSPIQEVGHGYKAKTDGGNVIVDNRSGDVMVVDAWRGHLWRSRDQGKTWKKEEIVIKPNAIGHGALGRSPVYTPCSESGITLEYGKHKGRLLMPCRVLPIGNWDIKWWPYHYNAAIYSDDGGKTWQTSEPVQSGTGEGTLAELSNGHIYYNSRSHMAVDHRRRIAWSYDGGHMWTDWQVSEHLYECAYPFYFKYGTKPSYGCNAGLVRLPLETTNDKDVLLFSAPDNPGFTRQRMTVWASFDGAKTWPVKRLVHEGPSGYSSLAAGSDGNIYLLFERGKKSQYETLSVARFNLQWLTEGQD